MSVARSQTETELWSQKVSDTWGVSVGITISAEVQVPEVSKESVSEEYKFDWKHEEEQNHEIKQEHKVRLGVCIRLYCSVC